MKFYRFEHNVLEIPSHPLQKAFTTEVNETIG